MVLNRTVFLVHCFCTISIASSTPFLQSLFLASSDDATHISDYRKQPRSDSRADKSQRFTLDTDFLSDDVQESSPFQPTNPENYAKILTKVIGNTREKYETIINNLQDYQSNARLTNIHDTSTDSDVHLNSPRTKPLSKKHFSRLVSTVMALNKLQQNKDPNFFSKYLTPTTDSTPITSPTAFFRYPLLVELWQNRATDLERKINAKSISLPSNPTIKTINGETTFDNYTNADQNSNRLNSAENDDTQKLLPVNVADVPFQLLYRIPRTRAKFALQNAFYKYSNSMPNKTIISQTNDSVGVVGAAAARDNGNEENSNALTIQASIITNGIPLGNNNDYLNNEEPINSVENFTTSTINYDDATTTNNNASFAYLNVRHINVQRQRKQQKQQLHTNNGDKENANDIDNNIANDDGNNNATIVGDDENVNINAETVGIFLLEIIGTVAGLTWGAFSQIQNSIFGAQR